MIENDTYARWVIRETLRSQGFALISALDLEEAVRLIPLKDPAVILLDQHLAGQRPWEAVEELQRHGPGVEIILFEPPDESEALHRLARGLARQLEEKR